MGSCSTKVEAFDPVNNSNPVPQMSNNTLESEKAQLFERIYQTHKHMDVTRLFDNDGTYSVSSYSAEYMTIYLKYGVNATNRTFETELKEYFKKRQPHRHRRYNTITL